MEDNANISCFSLCESLDDPCSDNLCRYWVDHVPSCNCSIVAANGGPATLEDVGKILGLSRMRVCQIEREAVEKFGKRLKKLNNADL